MTPGTTIVDARNTTTIPGSTITTPGSTVVSTITTTTPGNPALIFARWPGTPCGSKETVQLGGADGQYHGAVVSNSGVAANASRLGGDELIWGFNNPCGLSYNPPPTWTKAHEAPQLYDYWPIDPPICTAPSGTPCIHGTTTRATAISDGTTSTPCMDFSTFSSTKPGLYCSADTISLPNNTDLTNTPGFGFIAPDIRIRGNKYRGFPDLYTAQGGLFLYAYDSGGVTGGGSGMGFSGTIFATYPGTPGSPGSVDLSGSGTSSVCVGNATGCGFIESWKVNLTGSGANWAGLGPGFGGTTLTTTTTITPGTVTTTPDDEYHYAWRDDPLPQERPQRPRRHQHHGHRLEPRRVALSSGCPWIFGARQPTVAPGGPGES